MPIYLYQCQKCGERFVILPNRDQLLECIKCGSASLSRLPTRFRFSGKGSEGMENTGSSYSTCSSGNCYSCG
ncbi:MAG: hypothetical protein B6D53_03585 [Candidatus Omnitrophica bacterium 4484_49]|nr:zinc ribbon domain-containing protein [Candidatus Omnitrophota bacterium]OQX82893.1 MAG: hypothetical protein B6D53_03585 [Candidatus Omnitrophica bacterium 4484_49]